MVPNRNLLVHQQRRFGEFVFTGPVLVPIYFKIHSKKAADFVNCLWKSQSAIAHDKIWETAAFIGRAVPPNTCFLR